MVRSCDSNLRSMIINEIAPFFLYLFIIYISTFVKHPFNNSLASCSIIIFSLVIHRHSFCFQFYGGIVDLLCVIFSLVGCIKKKKNCEHLEFYTSLNLGKCF